MAQAEINSIIQKGLDYSYNFQLEEAEESFQKLIDKYPNDPRGYHYKSGVYLWVFLSNRDDKSYSSFRKYSDKAIEKAEYILDEVDEENENATYILGANYGFRAMASMKKFSYLDAVWSVKNSNK